MAEFRVPVLPILGLEAIAGADIIERATIAGYQLVVGKGRWRVGDLAAYIPEGSIVPEALIVEMDLVGRLAGKEKNRVKAVKLRGTLSQGLAYKPESGAPAHWAAGLDVAGELGVTKWDPPVPTHLAGEMVSIAGKTVKYDIENIKGWPGVLGADELVEITSKLHGTQCMVGWHPNLAEHPDLFSDSTGQGGWYISSKGLGGRGLVFKNNEANRAGNVYVRTVLRLGLLDKLRFFPASREAATLFGEVFGTGVQDLGYGTKAGEPQFRAFDVYAGAPGQGGWLPVEEKDTVLRRSGIERVPVVYTGPWNEGREALVLVDEPENISGRKLHVGEGIVITPFGERAVADLGRVIFKMVSEKYLLRKGDVTEYA